MNAGPDNLRTAPRLEVFTAAGCCLCDEARRVLDRLTSELQVDVTWTMIDGDPKLESAWRSQIPAGVLDGRKVFKYHVDEALLRRRLAPREPGRSAGHAVIE